MNYYFTKNNYLIILLIFFFFFILIDQLNFNIKENLLSWDEVNYAKSAEKGMYENAFEKNSLNFISFYNVGVKKLNQNFLEIKSLSESEIIEKVDDDDIFNLRHYHPPLYIYFLSFFTVKDNKILSDKYLRLAQKILSYTIVFSFILVFYLSTKNQNKNLISTIIFFLTLFLFFYSNIFQQNFNTLNFHTIFGLVSIFYFYSLYKYLIKDKLKNLLRLSLSISLLLLSLETAIILILFSIIYICFSKKFYYLISKNTLYLFINSLILFILFWPANLYNLTLVKTFSMYFYRLFLSSNDEYSGLNIIEIINYIFISNIEIFIASFFFIFLIYYFKLIYKVKIIIIILFSSLCYFIFILGFAHHTNYLFPSICIFLLFIVLLINHIEFKKNKFITIMLFSFLLITLINNFNKHDYNQNFSHRNNDIFLINQFLNENNSKNDIVIADGAHIFNYYSNKTNVIPLEQFSKENPKFFIRINYKFYDLKNLINKNKIKTIIISKNRKYSENQFNYLFSSGYKKFNFSNFYLFQSI